MAAPTTSSPWPLNGAYPSLEARTNKKNDGHYDGGAAVKQGIIRTTDRQVIEDGGQKSRQEEAGYVIHDAEGSHDI